MEKQSTQWGTKWTTELLLGTGQIPGSRDERGLTRLTYARLDVDLTLGEEVLQVLHPQLHQVAP